jgi:hypothetical protein
MELQCTVWNIVFAEGQMPLLSSVAQSIENLKPLLILIPDIKKTVVFARYRYWIIQSFHQSPSIKEVQVVFPLPVSWSRFLSTSRDRSRLSIEENRCRDGFTGSGRCGDRLRQFTFLNLKHY